MKKSTASSSGGLHGGSALMVILAVLCLTVFAILALGGALAGSRLEKASAASETAFYEADGKAEEILARLRNGEEPDGVTFEENGVCSYEVPMDATRTLFVKVRVTGSACEVLTWQVRYTGEWEIDDTLDLM